MSDTTKLQVQRLPELTKQIATIHEELDSLRVPSSECAVIRLDNSKVRISEVGHEIVLSGKDMRLEPQLLDALERLSWRGTDYGDERINTARDWVVAWFEKRLTEDQIKFMAAEVIGDAAFKPLVSDLWLGADVVPYFSANAQMNGDSKSMWLKQLTEKFDESGVVKVVVAANNEVQPSELVSLEDYERITPESDFRLLLQLGDEFKDKKIAFVNATPRGGGVALMRHALIRLFRLLGVDAHWYVMTPRLEAFEVTKTKFHNVLQAVIDNGVRLTDEDKRVYNTWIEETRMDFGEAFEDVDVLVVDDPQPSGLIPYVRERYPQIKIIYRSHIQIVADLVNKKGTAQHAVWEFIWKNVESADLFVSHPIPEFVPAVVDSQKVVYMPATTDDLDGLNKPLTASQMDYYLRLFDKYLLESNQTPLDRERPYAIQIARFDPSKGIPDVVESFRLLREKLETEGQVLPQLVIVGHGSIDDPDGIPVLNYVMELIRSPEYQDLVDDIKVARLPGIDQLLNALLRQSHVALQLSHKEGFEVKVTEALMKDKPVVAYKAGGIPLQIVDGKSGFLAEVGDTKQVADYLYRLFTDQALYEQMSKQARALVDPWTTTVRSAIAWMFLAKSVGEKDAFQGEGKHVEALMKESGYEVE